MFPRNEDEIKVFQSSKNWKPSLFSDLYYKKYQSVPFSQKKKKMIFDEHL